MCLTAQNSSIMSTQALERRVKERVLSLNSQIQAVNNMMYRFNSSTIYYRQLEQERATLISKKDRELEVLRTFHLRDPLLF